MKSRMTHPAAMLPCVTLAIQALRAAPQRAGASPGSAMSDAADRTPAPREPRRST